MSAREALQPAGEVCTLAAVQAAAARLAPLLAPTPLRRYPALEREAGSGISLWVKHENHQPTNSFKVRNGAAVVTALSADERRAGVLAASRGNHGLGLAWAAQRFGVPAAICVPRGNNPEKNEAIRDLGARLIECGDDYDECVALARERAAREGARLVHSTNDPQVLAGAGTLTLEICAQQPDLDALVFAVGGGSQAVGALAVVRGLGLHTQVYGVQASGASAIHDAWHAGEPRTYARACTLADGIATRSTYELSFPALQRGLRGFTAVSDGEIAAALRLLLRVTHNLAEGAGAAGLAGALRLREVLRGQRVGVVLSGGNIDRVTLGAVLAGAEPRECAPGPQAANRVAQGGTHGH